MAAEEAPGPSELPGRPSSRVGAKIPEAGYPASSPVTTMTVHSWQAMNLSEPQVPTVNWR